MAVLGGGAVSYERGTPVYVGAYDLLGVEYDLLATCGISKVFPYLSGSGGG
jgi:hypothetical protein